MKILYLSQLDWNFTKQRPQHLAKGLSEFFEVHYVYLSSWRNAITKKGNFTKKYINLRIFNILVLPLNGFHFVRIINNFFINSYIKKLMKKHNYDIVFYTSPYQIDWTTSINFKYHFYDCMDKYDEFIKNKKYLKYFYHLEKKMVNSARIIFCSSNSIRQTLITKYNLTNVELLSNGVDLTSFDVHKIVNPQFHLSRNYKNKKKYEKIIGYVGAISHWFDFESVIKLASYFPKYLFVLVGPIIDLKKTNELYGIDNILIEGLQSYESIPYYIKSFDLCIMPFLINDLVKFVNPVKVYEYLSLGKDVILPYYEELLIFNDLVYFYRSFSEFKDLISITVPAGNNLKNNRINFSKKNSWEIRVSTILEKFKESGIFYDDEKI